MAWPKLKAKGAEAKHVTPALKYAWHSLVPAGAIPFCNGVSDCLEQQCLIQDIVDENCLNDVLSIGDADRIMVATDKFLASYSSIAVLADTQAL